MPKIILHRNEKEVAKSFGLDEYEAEQAQLFIAFDVLCAKYLPERLYGSVDSAPKEMYDSAAVFEISLNRASSNIYLQLYMAYIYREMTKTLHDVNEQRIHEKTCESCRKKSAESPIGISFHDSGTDGISVVTGKGMENLVKAITRQLQENIANNYNGNPPQLLASICKWEKSIIEVDFVFDAFMEKNWSFYTNSDTSVDDLIKRTMDNNPSEE